MNLLNEFDAKVWAKEFINTVKDNDFVGEIDEELMLSWFACAIMTGYDEAIRRIEKDKIKEKL